ncbi:putative integral membrane protein [Cryptosporidium felis]|nr:putative integral membrane protein [Cryptosporidium felis]
MSSQTGNKSNERSPEVRFEKINPNSALYEKRLGLYVLMGSILYVLALKNKNEKGWLDPPFSWILILFRAGPLGGMILMIPHMISNVKSQIDNLCETLKLHHTGFQKKDLLNIALELFPNLNEQFEMINKMKILVIQGLYYFCIGESLSEISIQYSNNPNLILKILPFTASILRSLGSFSLIKCNLEDSKKNPKITHIFGALFACTLVTCLYIFVKHLLGNFCLSGRVILSQSLVGGASHLKVLRLFIHFELLTQILLLSESILRNRNSILASKASKLSPVVGSLLMVVSSILRCMHLESKILVHYIPYFEIGPLIWGLFIFIHSIAFYVRYDGPSNSTALSKDPNLVSFDKKNK